MDMSAIRIILTWILLNFCLQANGKQLLLLKQRSRLERLFSYEIEQCVKSASLLSSGLFSAPTPSHSAGHGMTICPDYISLTSVRSVLTDIAFGRTPGDLVDSVRRLEIVEPSLWTIEYECLAPLENNYLISPNGKKLDTADESTGIESTKMIARPLVIEEPPLDAETNPLKHQCRQSDRKAFSSKTIFLALSQCIRGMPAVDPREAMVCYHVLEISGGFYFGSVPVGGKAVGICTPQVSVAAAGATDTPTTTAAVAATSSSRTTGSNNNTPHSLHLSTSPIPIKELWAARPFIFSAALNIEIAEAVMNILKAKLVDRDSRENAYVKVDDNLRGGSDSDSSDKEKKNCADPDNDNFGQTTDVTLFNRKRTSIKNQRVFTILDPCCGSGTTLFAARR